ncbi:MAG: hypothetical protein Q4C66_02215 [Lachnospiraceae bacterium]|nr:hypothetical protein [Lachnospiraceae bacterium]
MENIYKGNALVAPGNHVNADTAMGWYIGMDALPPQEIAAKFMQTVEPAIAGLAKADDILVCGRNFGYGKVHSSFLIAVKTIGIRCIVAESFSTQMFNNLKSEGIAFVECPGILDKVNMSDLLEVNFAEGSVKNLTKGEEYQGLAPSAFILEVMQSGGMMPYLAKKGADAQK